MAANKVTADEVQTLSYWLEDVPRTLFGGFDRRTTRQLVARIDQSYRDLFIDRERLFAEFEKLRALHEHVEKREHELATEVGRLTRDLETSTEKQQSVESQLETARTRWDAELLKARADLQQELEQANGKLADYRRREILLEDVLGSARRRAKTMTDEARIEAEQLLRRARRRESQILREAQRELERLEAERERLQTLASQFRQDIAARLAATLEQLNRDEIDEVRRAGGVEERDARSPEDRPLTP